MRRERQAATSWLLAIQSCNEHLWAFIFDELPNFGRPLSAISLWGKTSCGHPNSMRCRTSARKHVKAQTHRPHQTSSRINDLLWPERTVCHLGFSSPNMFGAWLMELSLNGLATPRAGSEGCAKWNRTKTPSIIRRPIFRPKVCIFLRLTVAATVVFWRNLVFP